MLDIVYLQEILDHNQCGGAYWLGNLKNRDIQVCTCIRAVAIVTVEYGCCVQGHEILSQASQRSEEGEGEREEEGSEEEEMDEDDRSVTNSTSTDRKSRGV